MQNNLKISNRIFDIKQECCRDYVRKFRSKKKFVAQFPKDFDMVLAYHGSNLNSLEQGSIYKNGITLSTDDFLKEKAKVKFVHQSDNPATQKLINQAIDEYFDEYVSVENKIFFTQLKNELLTISPQYLLYGPETLLPLADKLRDALSINFRQRMIEHGDHCIITVLVPTAKMTQYDTGTIYEHINNDFIECCIVSRKSIPFDNIIKIEKFPRPVNIFE